MAFGAWSRHWTVWKAAWQEESSRPLGAVAGGRATEFLPAVLEIQETPPSPIGRAMLGKKKGEVAMLKLPARMRKLKIVELVTIHQAEPDDLD